ncbi:cobyrinate a,c-diamide synthase [uncultured Duncaniella sp.]|uniref:cobyrinate a,c-diamide synthase n=1 Tax=uncultured Duncaniella sp. TaxID=2768039 RepID=UPI00272B3FF4|nr:cobyrinate a,c-diamide synthase [uncultured Duncaniella sp.]
MKKSSFLIAAASSGSGKTTLSLGLMNALSRRGMTVQPFKCGPDYIDTQYHSLATGRSSINLDLFMSTEKHVKEIYSRYGADSDVNIVEGVMGMFDGYERMAGSSAELAEKLNIPVILLVNAASTAFSVAATIYGFIRFRKNVKVVGVIFNRVASENHYAFLKDACAETGVPSLGYIRKNDALKTPSRHLGLSLDSVTEIERFINAAAEEVERNIDIETLLSLTEVDSEEPQRYKTVVDDKVVAVAKDEAFNFIYPVNIEAFRSRIVYFSPLRDTSLPDADMIYLPGGYPELFADELERNSGMRKAINEYAESGGRILAECGGMIYLTEEIDGKRMCGVFPLKTTMEDARLTLGYRKVNFPELNIRGHEFHYSHTVPARENIPSMAQQFNVKGTLVATPVYRYRNTFAGYTHLYWGETDIFKLWN